MKRFSCICLALASAWIAGRTAHAGRPQYGGTLVVEIPGIVATLTPNGAAATGADAAARDRVLPLVFETLVGLDRAGGIRPLLAASWESDGRAVRWRFRLRPDVTLHDGTRLDAARAAAALGPSERGWTINADGEAITMVLPEPHPDLLWELTQPRHAIAVPSGTTLTASGPFQIDRVEPSRLMLRAHDSYWGGRPFVDRVQVEMSRTLALERADLEAGRADVIAAQISDVRRLTQRGSKIAATRPLTLYAIVFEPHRAGPASEPLRHAVAAAFDRTALSTALLQRLGEPAEALLPAWLSGYGPLFASDAINRLSPSAIRALPPADRTLALRTDPADPLAQTIAERLAVDAREIGVTLTVQVPVGLAPRADARLVRIPIDVAPPGRALASVVDRLGSRAVALAAGGPLTSGSTIEAVYEQERALLKNAAIVPVVRVPDVYAVAERVGSWNEPLVLETGAWNFASAWKPAKP